MNANNSDNKKPLSSKFNLTNYDFVEAIKYDTRSFWGILLIYIINKINIIHTFFYRSKIEPFHLRLCLFIFINSCDCTLNSLFYINKKISDRYHYDGEYLYFFTMINNITISLTSALSSFIIVLFFKKLLNPRYEIEEIFKIEEKKMRKKKDYKVSKTQKNLIMKKIIKITYINKIKNIIFLVIFFMLFFTYFISAFCAIFKETQKSWIIDCLVSSLISILLEFFISFLISNIYNAGVKNKLKILYDIALFVYKLG